MGAIKLLGDYAKRCNGLDDIETYIESEKLQGVEKVICIVFKRNDEGFFDYSGTHIEDYDKSKPRRYLYRSHTSNQFNITPSTKIAYDIKNKKPKIDTAYERIEYWFEKFKNELNGDTYGIEKVGKEITDKEKQIRKDIDSKIDALKNDELKDLLLTIKFKDNETENEKYLGDIGIFIDILKSEGFKCLYNKDGKDSKGNGVCVSCGHDEEVFDSFPFKFHTVNKMGFAPEFCKEDSWKGLPLCEHCTKSLLNGKNFLETYLKKNFYGYEFYVIPHFIQGELDDKLMEDLKEKKHDKDYESLLIEDEDYILGPIIEKGDRLNIIFMFTEKTIGGNYNIVKYVENVPPSWLKKLYETHKIIKGEREIFKETSLKRIGVLSKDKSGDLENILKSNGGITIGALVREFFPNSSKETGIYGKYFIDMIGDILARRTINRDLLINAFMREIRNAHVKDNQWRREKVLTLKSFMFFLFLMELKLIKNGENMVEQNIKSEKLEKFIKEYLEAFNSSDKIAVFLEGVLTGFLLDIQYANIKSTPFKSKLHGLHLDRKRICKLLPEIIQKLDEYKTSYKWLRELISEYLLKADNEEWKISKDEISYYFVLGLNLEKIFKETEEETEVINRGNENE